jgi:hypothetical protein
MSRGRRAADRIREEIPLAQVLADYGYAVYSDESGGREQQFSCDLHGDGSDNKPSARLYPHGNQFFCFACGISRDAIALVREKEGCSFWDAVKKLESRYGLAPLPWEDGDQHESPEKQLHEGMQQSLRPNETPEQVLHRLDTFLRGLTRERSLTPLRVAGFWEAHDRVVAYLADDGDAGKAVEMAHRVLQAAKDAIRGEV